MYKKSEVEKVAIEYFGDSLTANVWLDKYALKKSDNEYLEISPEETVKRLADEIHRIEERYPKALGYDRIYELLTHYKKFILAGSPLYGIGNNLTVSTLGNCFVVDQPNDSIGGLWKVDEELAQLMKRRGGVGTDLSKIRPRTTRIHNAALSSTGVVPFMEKYSNTTRTIAQEGRRGALMLSIIVSHPDILRFVTSKDDLTKITGANISVKITDKFMEAVEKDEDFELSWNDFKVNIKARKVWETIIHQAWKTAEPGLLFWDRIIDESPADCYEEFETIGTNPCSELPLCSYDSCRLGHLNLFDYVLSPFTIDSGYDLPSLGRDAYDCQRIMDDLVDLEEEKVQTILKKIVNDPEPDEDKAVELNLWNKIWYKLVTGRRTGLGQLGLADTMAGLGLKYTENTARLLAEEISRTIAINSYMSSIDMAEERGAFKAWNLNLEKDNPFIKRILNEIPEYQEKYEKFGRRNIANLTIAPTGSTAMLAGVSSGMEPVFALHYKRKRKVTEDHPKKTFKDPQGDWWEEYNIFHSNFKRYIETVSQASAFPDEMSDEDLKAWEKESPYADSCAHEVSPEIKINLQSVMQPWIDHSISVTYNLPQTATEADVSNLYFTAWKKGLKGLTVYRDGSRDGVLSSHEPLIIFPHTDAIKRPKIVMHDVYSTMSRGHHWIISVGIIEGRPYEVFAFNNINLPGTKFAGEMIRVTRGQYNLNIKDIILIENVTKDCSDEENLLTRMISTALRHGADMKHIVEQLYKSEGDITSFGKAIGRILKKYVTDGQLNNSSNNSICDNCGSLLVYEGGCKICKNCGSSKCD